MGGGDSILAILPIFHGFGLGVCVNAIFMGGGRSILVPQFTPEIVADLIKKKRPNFVVGVPTLFEALGQQSRLPEGRSELPQGDLQRRRYAPAAGQGAVRGGREEPGRERPAPRRATASPRR